MFIAVEGIQTTGKTEVASVLAQKLWAIYFEAPQEKFLVKQKIGELVAGREDQYRFYLDETHKASRYISELSSNNHVICDRYWASTYVHHLVLGAEVSRSDFEGIIFPDFTVLLTVSPEAQANRFRQKGILLGNGKFLEIQKKMAEEFLELFGTGEHLFAAIDTSYLTPSQVVDQSLAEIRKIFPEGMCFKKVLFI